MAISKTDQEEIDLELQLADKFPGKKRYIEHGLMFKFIAAGAGLITRDDDRVEVTYRNVRLEHRCSLCPANAAPLRFAC